jgi:hypothetical protein
MKAKKPTENELIRTADALCDRLFDEADSFLKQRGDSVLSFSTVAASEVILAILISVFADQPNMKSRGASAASMLDMFAKHVRELLAQRGHAP